MMFPLSESSTAAAGVGDMDMKCHSHNTNWFLAPRCFTGELIREKAHHDLQSQRDSGDLVILKPAEKRYDTK